MKTAVWKILFIIQFVFFENIISTDDFSKHKQSEVNEWSLDKRPFCNAFTGCGRKRTLRSKAQIETQETWSHLIDMSAVADEQRQIMSHGRMFEALKEAYKEILFQSNKDKFH